MFAKEMHRNSTIPLVFKSLIWIVFGIGIFQTHLYSQPGMDKHQEKKLKPDSISAKSHVSKFSQSHSPFQDDEQDTSFIQLYDRGLNLLNNNQPDSAIVYLQKASLKVNDRPQLMTNLARAYVDIKEFEKAQNLLDKLISMDSLNADAYIVIGRIKQSVGNYEQAIVAYQTSIELESDNPHAYNNLALIYFKRERFNDAISLLDRAVQLNDSIPFFYNNLGIAHEAAGNYQQAKQAFQKALSLDSNYEKPDINLKRIEEKIMQKAQQDSLKGNTQQAEAF